MGEQPAVVAKCWQLSRQPTTNAISNGNLGEARQMPIGRPGASSFHSQCTMSGYSATSIPYSSSRLASDIRVEPFLSIAIVTTRRCDDRVKKAQPRPKQ